MDPRRQAREARGGMSRSAGSGSPCFFRCAACRRKETSWRLLSDRGWVDRIELTGVERNRSRASVRHGTVLRQYRCLDCKHVGFSAHNDLDRKKRGESQK